MKREQRLDLFDIFILAVLTAMVVLSPLAMGSVAPWARNSIFVLSLLVTALWILQGARRGRLSIPREPSLVLFALFFLVVFFQLLPMAPSTLGALSKGTAELYGKTLAGYPASGEARTLSLTPYHTVETVRRFAAFALVFLVIASTFRTRRQAAVLLLAMVAAGTFEALYGFGEQFSGDKSIFWNPRAYHLDAVTGTFINKNHFAGFLEMVVPLALGLFMASIPRLNRSGNFRARAVDAASSPGLHRQIILGTVTIIMAVAIFFSLSRAGISGAIASWAAFFLLIAMTAGVRKYTLGLILIMLVILSVALGMGSEMVFEKMGNAASGESVSWTGRLDLWSSALGMIKEFPLFGTGLGTFEEAFERFQSSRFGDRYADFLHNDWLQVFCETGLLGGVLAVSAILLLFFRLAGRTLRRRDTFCRWIGTGAMAGCGAMLIHSFFDYNLYKIASNGLLFASIMGIFYAVANMAGKDKGSRRHDKTAKIPLGPAPVRVFASIIACGGLVLLAVPPVRSAAADIHFNRYLAAGEITGSPDDYFFLPLLHKEAIGPRREIERAAGLDGENPLLCFYEGKEEIRAADGLVREEVSRSLRDLLGPGERPDSPRLKKLRGSLFAQLLVDMAADRRPHLRAAEGFIAEAIEKAPAVKRYHISLAEIRAEEGYRQRTPENTPRGGLPGEEEARRALWLAPNKPGVLFRAGKVFLVGAVNSGTPLGGSALETKIEDCFRRSIASMPSYAKKVFPLVAERIGGTEALFAVTPNTIKGYDLLTQYLWERGEWEAVLKSLSKMERLCEIAGGAGGEPPSRLGPDEELSPAEVLSFVDGSSSFVDREPGALAADLSARRAAALSLLKRFDERKAESLHYRGLIGRRAAKTLDEARSLEKDLRFREALAKVREVLDRDWTNPEALLLAANLALVPGALPAAEEGRNVPLDLLYRFAVSAGNLDGKLAAEAEATLGKVEIGAVEEGLQAELVRGILEMGEGRLEAGLARLKALLERIDSSGTYWRQKHLVPYWRGRGLERSGAKKEAAGAYARVLEEVPAHLGALGGLARLDPSRPVTLPDSLSPQGEKKGKKIPAKELLGMLTPATRVNVSFGGKVVLLGYTMASGKGGENEGPPAVTWFWLFEAPVADDYQPMIGFRNSRWRILFQDNHRIHEAGKVYPVENPPLGAVVLDTRRLKRDPCEAEYLTVSFQSTAVHPKPPLRTDCGNLLFRTTTAPAPES